MTQPFEPVPARPEGGYISLAWTRVAHDDLIANFVHRDGRIWTAVISDDNSQHALLTIYAAGCRVYDFVPVINNSTLSRAAVAFANLPQQHYARLVDDREGTTTDPVEGALVVVTLQDATSRSSQPHATVQRLGRWRGGIVWLFPIYDEVVYALSSVTSVGVEWQGNRDWNTPNERPYVTQLSRADLDRVEAIRSHIIYRGDEPTPPRERRRILDIPDEK